MNADNHNVLDMKSHPVTLALQKYKDIREMLDKLEPGQVGEIRGYLKRMVSEKEAEQEKPPCVIVDIITFKDATLKSGMHV